MNILKIIKTNKVLALVISIGIAILLISFIGNKIIEYKISHWFRTTKLKVVKTEKAIAQILNYKQQKLLLQKNEILKDIRNHKNLTDKKLIEIITNKKYERLLISIIDSNNNLIAWNDKFISELKPFAEHHYKPNEVFFINTILKDYLIVTDTIGFNTNLKLLTAKIVEKKYKLSKEYFDEVSITKKVKSKIGVDVKFSYLFEEKKSKNNIKHSFDIYNNYGNIIAQATFIKPSKAQTIKKLKEKLFIAESIFILLGYFLLAPILYNELKKYKFGILKFVVMSFYLIVFRYLLLYLKFPHSIFKTELLKKTYYAATFGNGIAASPIDLGITFVILFIISYSIYAFIITRFNERKKTIENIFKFIIVVILVSIIYVVSFRGFSAAVKGIIFDSSIRYFQSITLVPTLPQFVMHLNLLIFGISFVLFSMALIFAALTYATNRIKKNTALMFILIVFIITELIYTFLQTHPLSNLVIKLITIVALSVFVYSLLNFDIKRISKIVIFFLAGSILSIVSLLNFNSDLEKESLKQIAGFITRENDNWYKQIITKTILAPEKLNKAAAALMDTGVNFDKYAFLIWSNSLLQKESLNSSVNFISINGEHLGGFGSVYPKTVLKFNNNNDVFFVEEKTEIPSQKIIRGIKAVKKNNKLLGYLDVSILSDINDFGFDVHPKFISSSKLNEIAILSLSKIKILDYQNGLLKNIYGEVNPSEETNDEILNADYSKNNETWLEENFNSGKHLVYAVKVKYNNLERILAVALRNKDLSFSLFDFFKIFFSHSIILLFIMLLVVIYFLNKRHEYLFDLRTQLLISFLIISLLPLIFLALYFRNLTEEKNQAAIYFKLGKRAFNVETYIKEHTNDLTQLDSVFVSASKDLNVNYSIFYNNKMIYSSQDLIYDVDLMPNLVNPEAYKKILLNGSQEVLVKENIDKYNFNTFYYKANILDKDYIVKVADAFNKILLPLSGTEVDVFLFGTYSLAVILVILLSAYLANRISAPIRKLTEATKSVAHGDLNLKIKINAKAEIKELVEGFQYMIKEIKKNQTIIAEIEREEAWKEMAKQVAHEIKNPLTPMKLSIQQLVTAYNDKSAKFNKFFNDVTTMLLNQIETLKNIATEFSNFARMPKLKVDKINCIKTISQAINLFTDKKIKIKLETPLTACIIEADDEQLKRTLINLIRNSIQAGANNIILNLTANKLNYILKIIDNGKGIKKEHINKIFEPNFTTKQEGMGLGLSMAKRYFNNTGGKIEIESTNPNGTIIKITLPKK